VRDGHFCVYSEQGYEFPLNHNEKNNVVAAVVITTSSLRILFRRRIITRKRPLNIFKIIIQQRQEIRAAKKYTKMFNIPLYIIKNNNFDKAAKKLSKIFCHHLG
jgi:guanylate kinase